MLGSVVPLKLLMFRIIDQHWFYNKWIMIMIIVINQHWSNNNWASLQSWPSKVSPATNLYLAKKNWLSTNLKWESRLRKLMFTFNKQLKLKSAKTMLSSVLNHLPPTWGGPPYLPSPIWMWKKCPKPSGQAFTTPPSLLPTAALTHNC